jgi:hypothetical protein
MHSDECGQAGKVIDLDAARERRRYIDLAHAHETWQQIKASFALSDIELDEDDAELAGRLFAGVITVEQGQAAIAKKLGVTAQ